MDLTFDDSAENRERLKEITDEVRAMLVELLREEFGEVDVHVTIEAVIYIEETVVSVTS